MSEPTDNQHSKPTAADRDPLYLQTKRSDGSETLLPNEHLRMLTGLLKPCGPELARRWLAALMMVPEDRRETIVEAVEAQIVEEFDHHD